jgi:hypothetical protein
MGIAAPAEFDRHAASLASTGLDLGRQCAASGDRRLRGLDAGRVSWTVGKEELSKSIGVIDATLNISRARAGDPSGRTSNFRA